MFWRGKSLQCLVTGSSTASMDSAHADAKVHAFCVVCFLYSRPTSTKASGCCDPPSSHVLHACMLLHARELTPNAATCLAAETAVVYVEQLLQSGSSPKHISPRRAQMTNRTAELENQQRCLAHALPHNKDLKCTTLQPAEIALA